MARLIADPAGKQIARADVVIEAIVEKLEVKQDLFQKLERQAEAGRGAGDQYVVDRDSRTSPSRWPIPAG